MATVTPTPRVRRPRPIRDAISTTFTVAGELVSGIGTVSSDLIHIASNSTRVMRYESDTDAMADMADAMFDRVDAATRLKEAEAQLSAIL